MADEKIQKLAQSFRRFGWAGFFIQLILAIIPLFMLGYFLINKATGGETQLRITDFLGLIGLAALGFTIIWSYRYTRIGTRLQDPNRRPTMASIMRTLWVGLWAGCFGISVSVLLLLIEVIRLVFLFLKAPQAGVPVVQTQIGRDGWVSAIDAVSLLAELCTLIGELTVVGFSLWLMYRVYLLGSELDKPKT